MTVETVHGAAPGSLWMYLPEQDVLFAGDTVVAGTHPIMATSPGTQAWLVTLQSLRRPRYAKTVIVPGRGPLCDSMATSVLSDYIATARRRVRALHAAGRPRAETAGLVAELLPLFPVVDEERDLVQRRVKASLDRLYEELRQG